MEPTARGATAATAPPQRPAAAAATVPWPGPAAAHAVDYPLPAPRSAVLPVAGGPSSGGGGGGGFGVGGRGSAPQQLGRDDSARCMRLSQPGPPAADDPSGGAAPRQLPAAAPRRAGSQRMSSADGPWAAAAEGAGGGRFGGGFGDCESPQETLVPGPRSSPRTVPLGERPGGAAADGGGDGPGPGPCEGEGDGGCDPSSRRAPPGAVFAETALLDSYSWHGIKSLYGSILFFTLLFLAVWFQTEPGASAFKSSVVSSFASWDDGTPWDLSPLGQARDIPEAFEYIVSYMGSLVKKSGEHVMPEDNSVYLGDFAHITYAQLEILFDPCSDSSQPENQPIIGGLKQTVVDFFQFIMNLVTADLPMFHRQWWARYSAGAANNGSAVTQLPDRVPLKDLNRPPLAPGVNSIDAGVLTWSMVAGDEVALCGFAFNEDNITVDASHMHDNIRNVLVYQYQQQQFQPSAGMMGDSTFLDLIGRLKRLPDNTNTSSGGQPSEAATAAGGNATGDVDLGGYMQCAGPYTWRCAPITFGEYGDANTSACFCANDETGLPRTLRAYMDPADPRDTTLVVELVRLWPDILSGVSLEEMKGGLDYLLGAVRGTVGKYGRQVTLALHAYDRRNYYSSVIFYLQATRSSNRGKLDMRTLTMTLNTRWRTAGLTFMGLAIAAAALDIALTLRAVVLTCHQGRGVWAYVTGGSSWHPVTWHGLDLLHHFAICAWVAMWVRLLHDIRPTTDPEVRVTQLARVAYPQGPRALEAAARRASLFTSWLYFGLALFLVVGLRCFRYMKYHAGLRIFYTLFRLAFHDILEFATFVVCLGVLLGTTVFGVFIISGGNSLFAAFGSGFTAMLRLSFGLLDYSDFVTDSNGLGRSSDVIVVFFWLSVLLLVLVVQNTLLAIFTRAYETAKDSNVRTDTIFFVTALYDALFVAVRLRNAALVAVWALLTDPLGLCKYGRANRRRLYWSAEYAAMYGIIVADGRGWDGRDTYTPGEGTPAKQCYSGSGPLARVWSWARRQLCRCGVLPAVSLPPSDGAERAEGAPGQPQPQPQPRSWLRRLLLYVWEVRYRFRVYTLEASCRDFELLAVACAAKRSSADAAAEAALPLDDEASDAGGGSPFRSTMSRWRLASSPQLRCLVATFTDYARERLHVRKVTDAQPLQLTSGAGSLLLSNVQGSLPHSGQPSPPLPPLRPLHEHGVVVDPGRAASGPGSLPLPPPPRPFLPSAFERPSAVAAATAVPGGAGGPTAFSDRGAEGQVGGGDGGPCGSPPLARRLQSIRSSRVVTGTAVHSSGLSDGGSGTSALDGRGLLGDGGGDGGVPMDVEPADLEESRAAISRWRVPVCGRDGESGGGSDGGGGGSGGGAGGVGAQWGPVKLLRPPPTKSRSGGGRGPQPLSVVQLTFYTEAYESEVARLFTAGPRALGLALEAESRAEWGRLGDHVLGCCGRCCPSADARRRRQQQAGKGDGGSSGGNDGTTSSGGGDGGGGGGRGGAAAAIVNDVETGAGGDNGGDGGDGVPARRVLRDWICGSRGRTGYRLAGCGWRRLWRCVSCPWCTLALCGRAVLLWLRPNPFWPFLECGGEEDEDVKKLVRALVGVYGPMPPHMTELQHMELRHMRERSHDAAMIQHVVRETLKKSSSGGRRRGFLPGGISSHDSSGRADSGRGGAISARSSTAASPRAAAAAAAGPGRVLSHQASGPARRDK